jgi:hypothetical protein
MTMCTTSLLLLTLLAQALPSTGDPRAKAEAQALMSQGTKLYEQGDVAGALEKFQAAYVAFPSPKLMFNIAQANRALSRPVEAMEAFEKFLVGAADSPPEKIDDARRSVAQLQEKLGRIQIDCDTTDAEVGVDGKRVALIPLPDAIWATPGRHQVTAKHASMAPAIEDVVVTAGSVSNVNMRMRSLAPAPKAAPNFDVQATSPNNDASQGWWLGRKWTWVAAGSTVLLAVGAITAGLSMQSKFDSLRSSCGAGNPVRPGCPQSDIDSVNSRQTTANVFWALTAVAAVTTGALFYFEGRAVTVTPVAGGATGFAAAVGY